jgi:hypothetical protein
MHCKTFLTGPAMFLGIPPTIFMAGGHSCQDFYGGFLFSLSITAEPDRTRDPPFAIRGSLTALKFDRIA